MHTHPCSRCRERVECHAPLEANYDGVPTVICSAYHATETSALEFECESCASTKWCIGCGDARQDVGEYCAACDDAHTYAMSGEPVTSGGASERIEAGYRAMQERRR